MPDPNHWHRRQALQLASQLPEDPEDAWKILEALEELVNFWVGPRPADPGGGAGDHTVVRFPGS